MGVLCISSGRSAVTTATCLHQQEDVRVVRAMCYLFQRPLDLHSLSPGNGGVGQAVAIVGPPGEVDALLLQVAEGLRHHLHGVVRQR